MLGRGYAKDEIRALNGLQICKSCGKEKHYNDFPISLRKDRKDLYYLRTTCYACKYEKAKSGYLTRPGKKEEIKEYQKRYHRKNPEVKRYKSLKSFDTKKGFGGTLSLEEYRDIIEFPCFYCHARDHVSVDRLDNCVGHTWLNCVACCEKCNMILGDLPLEVKLLLRPGLRKARILGALDEWTIPTKR